MASNCEEFYRMFHHVDRWLRSEADGKGYLFVPKLMDDASAGAHDYIDTLLPLTTESSSTSHPTQGQRQSPECSNTLKHIQQDDIDSDYLQAVLINRRHVQEREWKKKQDKIAKKKDKIEHVDIVYKESLTLNAKRKSTVERNVIKRRRLYDGESAERMQHIEQLESELQSTFDNFMKVNRPKLWPCIPVRLTFDD